MYHIDSFATVNFDTDNTHYTYIVHYIVCKMRTNYIFCIDDLRRY